LLKTKFGQNFAEKSKISSKIQILKSKLEIPVLKFSNISKFLIYSRFFLMKEFLVKKAVPNFMWILRDRGAFWTFKKLIRTNIPFSNFEQFYFLIFAEIFFVRKKTGHPRGGPGEDRTEKFTNYIDQSHATVFCGILNNILIAVFRRILFLFFEKNSRRNSQIWKIPNWKLKIISGKNEILGKKYFF